MRESRGSIRNDCESTTTYQRTAEIRRRHVADAAEHYRRADADVTHFRRKYLVGEYVDAAERDADEAFAEHRERHRRHVIFCAYTRAPFSTVIMV